MDLVSQLRRSSDSFDKMMSMTEQNSVAISSFDIQYPFSIKLLANEANQNLSSVFNIASKLSEAGVNNSDDVFVTNVIVNLGTHSQPIWMDGSTFFNFQISEVNSAKLLKIYQSNLLDTSFFTQNQKQGIDNVNCVAILKVFKKQS